MAAVWKGTPLAKSMDRGSAGKDNKRKHERIRAARLFSVVCAVMAGS